MIHITAFSRNLKRKNMKIVLLITWRTVSGRLPWRHLHKLVLMRTKGGGGYREVQQDVLSSY